MKFSIKYPFLILLLCLFVQVIEAQKPRKGAARQTAEEYIDRYKSLAISHMEQYGIPASITLAQGILESDSGNSWLSLQSNNHFGIKCKRDWKGDKVYHDDDAKGECFRSYPTVEDSYRDHSEFLDTSPRYDSLFSYSATDYRSWARGLKAAGYATAPDYAQRLIGIIERYELFLLDRTDGVRLYASRHRKTEQGADWFAGQSSVSETEPGRIDPDNFRVIISTRNGYNIYATNGVHYVLAREGDTYAHIAEKFGLSARALRKYNDIKSAQAQPMTDEPIYIERKKKAWTGEAVQHTCRAGETIYAVGQLYAIRTRSIQRMNHLRADSSLAEGREIRIR